MSSKLYRQCKFATFNQDIKMADFPGRFWCVLVGPDSTYFDEEPAVMEDITTLDEVGDARDNLAAFSVFTDIPQSRVYIPSNLLIPDFTMAAGEIVAGCVVYYSPSGGGHGDDALNIPMYAFKLPSPKEFETAQVYRFPFAELEFLAEMPAFGEKAYLIGRKNLLENQHQWTTGFSLALVKEGSNYFSVVNPSTIADITEEFAGSGYARQAVTLTITIDPDRDRVMCSAADPAFGVLGDDDAKIVGGVLFITDMVNGVANTLAVAMRLPAPVDPGGAAFTFPFSTDGVAYL